jgi:Tol biopolymer transport system component
LAVGLAALLVGTGAVLSLLWPKPIPENVLRFRVYPPGKTTGFAISPDGRRLVFSAANDEGAALLWIHSFDSPGEQQLPGTENAAFPFWSPDSRYVAFFADGKLKRISLAGAAPQVLCDAASGKGGTWGIEGSIVFADGASSGLFRVAAGGGVPQPVVSPEASRHAVLRTPYFLPDGRHFLYLARAPSATDSGVFIGSLDSKPVQRLAAAQSAAYASGTLLFVQDGALMARHFDPVRIEFVGEPRRIPFADHIRNVSASDTVLAYQSVEERRAPLVFIDREGRIMRTIEDSGEAAQFSLSPDARALAMSRNGDIWISDLSRSVTSRLTFAMAGDAFPVWSPDSSRIVFHSNRGGVGGLYEKVINGEMEKLIWNTGGMDVESIDDWSADGRFIIYTARNNNGRSMLWALPTTGERKPFLIRSSLSARQGRLSPDARWLAYVSDESGVDEVYVQTFPDAESRWQISTHGGDPRWRRDGRELFYMASEGGLSAVTVTGAASTLQFGAPRKILNVPRGGSYDVAPTGSFAILPQEENAPPAPINVVVNWAGERF